ncbi:MAG: hypothetical protein M3P26_10530 [Gemmatimonadota bacterium]|nr:hypothetical protein [Gemmatimonadota bacterium]
MITTYCTRSEAEGHTIPPHIVSAERGVYEDLHAPSGLRVFKVVSSVPGEVGTVLWPEVWVTPQFIANLERGLDLRDPQQLKAI